MRKVPTMNKFSDDLLDAVTSILKGQPVEEKKKLDPVDKKELKGKHSDREDGDIDNDGDEDESDEYMHKKRKAISKAMNKEATEHDPKHVKQAIGIASDPRYKKGNMTGAVQAMNKLSKGIEKHPQVAAVLRKQNEQVEESKDLDVDNVEKALKHDCATHVNHEEWGAGQCIPGMHTIEEARIDPKKRDAYNAFVKKNKLDDDSIRMAADNPDHRMSKTAMSGPKGPMMQKALQMYKSSIMGEDFGIVTHYDVMFEHGIEENVPVTELKVIKSMNHGHPRKKKEG